MRVQSETIVVVAGGHPLGGTALGGTVPSLPAGAMVIAADGGVDRALALGLHVDLAIGDFDSVSADGLAAAEAGGARIERHPAAKDATDLELALDAAIALRPSRILVVGSDGGRLDHLLASVLLLADERYAATEVDAYLGDAWLYVIRDSRTIDGAPGDLLTLVPVHGAAEGVTTEGLEYPLRNETLPPGTSRGVSNVFAASRACVTLERGCLLAIYPGPETEKTL